MVFDAVPANAPAPRLFPYISGNYMFPSGGYIIKGVSVGQLANTLYACPYGVTSASHTFAKFGIRVLTAYAGSNIRVGIYDCNAAVAGKPGNLLYDFGTVSGATAGEVNVIQSIPLIYGGYYWAFMCDTAAPNLVIDCLSAYGHGMYDFGGANGTTSGELSYWTAAQSFGAMPSVFPTSVTFNSGDVPCIWAVA